MTLGEHSLEETNSQAFILVDIVSLSWERVWVTFHVILRGSRMNFLFQDSIYTGFSTIRNRFFFFPRSSLSSHWLESWTAFSLSSQFQLSPVAATFLNNLTMPFLKHVLFFPLLACASELYHMLGKKKIWLTNRCFCINKLNTPTPTKDNYILFQMKSLSDLIDENSSWKTK